MGLVKWSFIVGVAVVAWVAVKVNQTPPLPEIDPDPWWGPGERREQSTNVRPFKIDIPQKDIDDLKARLSLPSKMLPSFDKANFTYGVNSVYFPMIMKYWKDTYQWRKREKKLNLYSHFKTFIEGLDIHFLRASPPKNSGKKVVPVLLLHGWPGSFVEFIDMIPYLIQPQTNSDVVFEVICPSIPGFGFSEGASRAGLNTLGTAQIFAKLMTRLGFEKFYVQGGDYGSVIATDLATAFPDRLYGQHLNMIFPNTIGVQLKTTLGAFLPSGMIMDPFYEQSYYPLSELFRLIMREIANTHNHAARPDTMGVALTSSPQGLAAYILEKFSAWTDMKNMNKPDGGLLEPDFPIALDRMLDDVSIYWFTGCVTSAMRFDGETFGPASHLSTMDNIPTSVPAGLAITDRNMLVVPKNFAVHKYTNIVTYTNPIAGHFAALEIPAELAMDLHNFVNIVERKR